MQHQTWAGSSPVQGSIQSRGFCCLGQNQNRVLFRTSETSLKAFKQSRFIVRNHHIPRSEWSYLLHLRDTDYHGIQTWQPIRVLLFELLSVAIWQQSRVFEEVTWCPNGLATCFHCFITRSKWLPLYGRPCREIVVESGTQIILESHTIDIF